MPTAHSGSREGGVEWDDEGVDNNNSVLIDSTVGNPLDSIGNSQCDEDVDIKSERQDHQQSLDANHT